jgi:hypothetical protein
MKPLEKYDCSSLSITEELFWKTLGADGEPKIFGTLNLSLCESIMLEFLKELSVKRPTNIRLFGFKINRN